MKKIVLDHNKVNRKMHMSDLLKLRLEYGKFCIHPLSSKDTCTTFSGAHNIQRNGPLKRLQKDNHVLLPIVDGYSGKLKMKRLGIKKSATVFAGLCNEHDRMFSPIEDIPLIFSEHQLFLFAYRSFAYAYFKVKREFYCHEKLSQKYEYPSSELIKSHHENLIQDVRLVEEEKKYFDDAIIKSNYSVMTHHVEKISYKINFATSTVFQVNFDLFGNEIIHRDNLDLVYFTVMPDKDGKDESYIMISWLNKSDKVYKEFKSQLETVPIKFLLKYLNNLLPFHAENIVLDPEFWEVWSSEQQQEFIDIININLLTNWFSTNSNQYYKSRSFNLFEK